MYDWGKAILLQYVLLTSVWYPQETGKANKNVSDWNVQQSPGG